MGRIDPQAFDMTEVPGRVVRLWRYPVKSMMGENCAHLEVDHRGAVGDRLFAVRDADGKFGSGKTTRRFRKIDGLLGFRAAYEHDVPRITFPDGRVISGDDSKIHAALSHALGQQVELAREACISHLDAGPLHLVTTASLRWLKALLPDALIDERRFRPNLLIDLPGVSQSERHWLGTTLHIGEVTLRVRDLTERCVMVNLPQVDLTDDPRVLRSLSRDSDSHFGVYAEVDVPGMIKQNDVVLVGR